MENFHPETREPFRAGCTGGFHVDMCTNRTHPTPPQGVTLNTPFNLSFDMPSRYVCEKPKGKFSWCAAVVKSCGSPSFHGSISVKIFCTSSVYCFSTFSLAAFLASASVGGFPFKRYKPCAGFSTNPLRTKLVRFFSLATTY